MQSSNLKIAIAIRDEYESEFLRECFELGYNHAHGVACHNVPTIGETIWTDSEGRVTVDGDNIADIHRMLCFEAELNARCYSPWEHYAYKINSHEDSEEGWSAYENGVDSAIEHDLKGYDYD